MHRIFNPALACLLLVCCVSSDPDTHLDVTYDPCAGLVVSAPAANAEQSSNIDAALASWSSVTAARLTRTEVPGWPSVKITFQDAPEAMRGVYDDERGLVFVNRRLENPRSMRITIAHELGHAFGLWHVDGRASVMNAGNIKIDPNTEDAASLRALWPSCSAEQLGETSDGR